MTARTAARRTCDAPGCSEPIRRGMLMCRAHWFATPKPLRDAINDSWKAGRIREWSAHCLEARGLHASRTREPRTTATPQAAYAANARLMGERE